MEMKRAGDKTWRDQSKGCITMDEAAAQEYVNFPDVFARCFDESPP